MQAPEKFQQQSGNVMLLSLVLLTAITLLGTSAMQGAIHEERIASNQLERHLATEGAQSALAVAVRNLEATGGQSTPALPIANLLTGDTAPDPNNLAAYRTAVPTTLWGTNAPTLPPEFMIELFANDNIDQTGGKTLGAQGISESQYYRIYGRGTGRDRNQVTQSILESVVKTQ